MEGAARCGVRVSEVHPMAKTPEQPIRIGLALKKYGIGKSTIYRKFEDGKLTKFKFGGVTFLCEREIIDNMIAEENAA